MGVLDMARLRADQAEGLRRMLAPHRLRVVSVVGASARVGASTVVINLASALATLGRRILVVDASANRGLMAAARLRGNHDLMQHVANATPITQVIEGVALCCVPTRSAERAHLSQGARLQWQRNIERLDQWFDVVLVDVGNYRQEMTTLTRFGPQETIVVLSSAKTAITNSYALMKALTPLVDQRHFRAIVNKVASADEADQVFANLAHASRRFLGVSVDAMGYLPRYEHGGAAQAWRCASVHNAPGVAARVRALAESLMAWPHADQHPHSIAYALNCLAANLHHNHSARV